ncbi:4110_t:CDS:2 [Ambispora gerdemannii]|uniref:4110_t:CDS:1 n=1 Tax=Ambispora gerdemannii TaxID=144530 RepID=A0A9N8VLM0_9GLOM|nr:4110_t:CDS:2 [Ambispora gerdemannii]
MEHIEDLALAHRLEHYRSRQEAAKGFDDDLEFCPSLSAEELLREFLNQITSHNSPSSPNNNNIPSSIPSPFFSRPGSPYSFGSFSPTLTYQALAVGPNAMTMTTTTPKATKSIPIVDPNSGNIVNMPGNSATSNTGNNSGSNNGFGGSFYSDISVR